MKKIIIYKFELLCYHKLTADWRQIITAR